MKTKNLFTNRILSIVLALVMVAGMLPMTALAAEEEVKYDVWIGGEEFTSEKLIIQGDTGTATYDPNTKTLTLDHYTYTGDGLDEDWLSMLICAYDDLNIVLKGENRLISTCNCHSYCYGIYNGNGFTTIIGDDAQSDSLLVQSKGKLHSMGLFTYSKGIRVESCTLTVKSEEEDNSNIAMYFRGETTFRSCTVDVSCANGDGLQNGIIVTNGINMEESSVTVSTTGGEAIIGQINLIYPGGYAWKVSRDVEYTTEPFAYNQESYLAIKPEAFMATWTDGEGASYEKTFRYGEVITLPTSTFFEETFRRGGYTLTEWQGYTEGMTMPMRSVTFTAVYAPNQYTVTYMADGESVSTEMVGYGNDATLPTVPAKDGCVGKWDSDGKNITGDTTITVVYTAIPAVKPDEVKQEDKTNLENVKAKLEEELKDDFYTDNDKKDIQDAIDNIDKALEVIGSVEAVEVLIDKLPDTIKKDDEPAIKAADDAYNALSDYEKSLVDKDAKKALDDAKAALAELNKPADTDSPLTGDNSHVMLWIALLFISGGAVITLTVVERKRRTVSNR